MYTTKTQESYFTQSPPTEQGYAGVLPIPFDLSPGFTIHTFLSPSSSYWGQIFFILFNISSQSLSLLSVIGIVALSLKKNVARCMSMNQNMYKSSDTNINQAKMI